MERTIVQVYLSELVRHLEKTAKTIHGMKHQTKKGQLREIFVENLVKKLIPTQFDTGNGFIVNQCGDISKEFDVIIYDGTLIPPFLKEYNVGIYPAESVLATIEVKSWLSKDEIIESNQKANELFNIIYNRNRSFYSDIEVRKPICTVFGFYDKTNFNYDDKKGIRIWFEENTPDLWAICLLKRFSWILVRTQRSDITHFKIIPPEEINIFYEETKSFFALLLDTIYELYKRNNLFESMYRNTNMRNYYSIYLRDQPNLLKEICR